MKKLVLIFVAFIALCVSAAAQDKRAEKLKALIEEELSEPEPTTFVCEESESCYRIYRALVVSSKILLEAGKTVEEAGQALVNGLEQKIKYLDIEANYTPPVKRYRVTVKVRTR